MSFILDALKKSESERHRHSGPVLMDVRIAPPRRRVPVWAWVIAAVLVVNLGVLAWALWRAPDKAEVAGNAAPVASPPPATPPAAPSASALPASPLPEPTLSQAVPSLPAQPPPLGSPAAASTATGPALAPPNAAPPAVASPDIDVTTLPKVQDLLAAGVTLPQLTLNLHVYDPQPANRYVLLNGRRTRESDFTAEGARVVQITATGVVVEWRGRRMFLSAGG